MSRRPSLLASALVASLPCLAAAQPVSLDKGVLAGRLWCFPLASDPRQYVYLPNAARLALDDAGRPQFSFVRYVLNKPGEAAASASITSAAGGGILHFLVQLETREEDVRAARQALQREAASGEVVLGGPLVFRQARYALVSSVLNPASAAAETRLLATGAAPVMQGQRLAFSFDLDAQRASLLMRSFELATPDVSLVFDMTFDGLTEAYDAELTIDWEEVRKREAFAAGASAYFVSADVERTLDELRRNNAVRLRSSGSGAMEGLLTATYGKLVELLFRPLEPERAPAAEQAGLLDALGALLDPRKGLLSSRRLTGFGAHVAYQAKELKARGTSVLTFNHRASAERHSFVTFNIGDVHRRFGSDARYFRAVNLADPTFQQREVRVGVDGALLPDFERTVNAVTVTLRKRHANGQQTVRELVLDRQSAAKAPEELRLVYGWNGDQDQLDWLQYEYRTRWSFHGGGTHETDWVRTDGAMIDVFAPYQRQLVRVAGSAGALQSRKVRSVSVLIEYPFFGERRRQQVVFRPEDAAEPAAVAITLPLNQFEYEYAITWQLDGGRRLSTRGRDASGTLFVDELPEDGGA